MSESPVTGIRVSSDLFERIRIASTPASPPITLGGLEVRVSPAMPSWLIGLVSGGKLVGCIDLREKEAPDAA